MRIYNDWAGNPKGTPEDETRCVESVHEAGRGTMSYQCRRPRGFGEDRLYCRQHAKKHPGKSETQTVYVLCFEYNEPKMAKVEVTRFTVATIDVVSSKDIIGRLWLPKGTTRLANKYTVVSSEEVGREVLRSWMRDLIARKRDEIAKIEKRLKEL